MMKTIIATIMVLFVGTATASAAFWQLDGAFIVTKKNSVTVSRLLDQFGSENGCIKGARIYVETNKAAVEALGGLHLEEGDRQRGNSRIVGVTTWRCTKY